MEKEWQSSLQGEKKSRGVGGSLYVAHLCFGNPKREYKLEVLNLTNLIIKA